MNQTEGTSAIVDALRLGLEPKRVQRFTTEFTLYPETMTIQATEDGESPLLICLHPPRLTEFQFAQRMRELTRLEAHLAQAVAIPTARGDSRQHAGSAVPRESPCVAAFP